ncbi:GTPase HflX [bacterium]|nr:GTPase HflX [bacterium]
MKVEGELRGLAPSQIRQAEKLFRRSIPAEEVVTVALAREIAQVAQSLGRRVGVLLSRAGKVEKVILGTREILYLPDLGRYRLGKGRLRRLRLIFSDLSKGEEDGAASIPSDIYTDLEKLRLDAVVGVRENAGEVAVSYAYLQDVPGVDEDPFVTEEHLRFQEGRFSFLEVMQTVEYELDRAQARSRGEKQKNGAVIIGVYPKQESRWEESVLELQELARTAGLPILDTVVQRRTPDPKTLVGRGKLEELVLRCLRLEAEVLLFDGELKPFQWRIITNMTELKVLDRSMVILDIFAQRAKSSDGRLQVELAQLKYNLPRLVEKDVGLSRLVGGIGGRGPGETKLEISRRRARDRIRDLEKRIEKLRNQRELRRKRRKSVPVPLIAIIGYTNAGKSTLFNALTASTELAEDKLFATLEPSQGRCVLPPTEAESLAGGYGTPVVFTDTVGFIRDLPDELRNAFRATLEELYEADLLLHVVDSSSPYAEEQLHAVERVLEEMELRHLPRIVVWNKSDLLQATPERRDELQELAEGVFASAMERQGIVELTERLRAVLP